MNTKKLVVLLISIIFPLLVTVFIGMYSYGTFGNWTQNQTEFKESIFNTDVETSTSIENYVKFASSHYMNVSENMNVYSDYESKDVIEAKKGTYTIDNKLTLSTYLVAETTDTDTVDPYISYMFFLYNINYNNIDPADIYFISVQGSDEEGYAHLGKAIEQFTNTWVEEGLTGSATVSSSRGTPYAIYDIHAILKDDSDSDTTPFAYSLTPNRNYTVIDEEGVEDTPITFNQLANCSFAIVETENENQVNVLFAGTLSNIKRTADAASKDANILKGYGSTSIDELGALEQAGYFKFVLPTLLWQCGLALLISGFVAVFFYFTWTYEEEAKTPKKLKKNKAKK